jgi:flavin reductase (DIM6/NTAB) family NADH-FMN oxidoreductase RutF
MNRVAIRFDELAFPVFRIWKKEWFLLTAGDFQNGSYNSMTVAWGCVGALWDTPVVMVVVRPSRYTFEFMEKYPDYTLCHFPKEYKKQLLLFGSRSGRDVNKIEQGRLTPIASRVVSAPSFEQADLILECSHAYADDYNPEALLSGHLREGKRSTQEHRFYYGEIRAIFGVESFRDRREG